MLIIIILVLDAEKLHNIVDIVCHVATVVFDALKLQMNVWIILDVLDAEKLHRNVCIILDVLDAEKLHRNVCII